MPKPASQHPTEIRPDPKLEKRTRRIFSADYKLSILQQADACQHGGACVAVFTKESVSLRFIVCIPLGSGRNTNDSTNILVGCYGAAWDYTQQKTPYRLPPVRGCESS